MKIVLDENIPMLGSMLAAFGEVLCKPGRHIEPKDLNGADALIVRSVTPVDARLLEGSAIRFVGSATIGCDHVDQVYLKQRNIDFAFAPGCNARAVVEYVLVALFEWVEQRAKNLNEMSVAVVGCGRVGGALVRMLGELGVPCVAYDPPLKAQLKSVADNAHEALTDDLDDVIAADIICLHTPLTHEGAHPSYHLFDEAVITALKPGSVLLNAGRGSTIDQRALLKRLQTHNDIDVILDVWEHEPKIDLEMLSHTFLASPHIAGYSVEGKLNGSLAMYLAFCEAFEFTPSDEVSLDRLILSMREKGTDGSEDVEAAEGVDSLRPTLINASGVRGEASQPLLYQALRASFDVRVDDCAMRKLLKMPDANQRASYFDGLRKQYRQRYQFDRYAVPALAEHEPQYDLLKKLGFKVDV